MEKIRVVIIGGLHHNTLGVLRSLGEAGIDKNSIHIILIGTEITKKNIISSSKYINLDHIFTVQSYDEICSFLLQIACDKKKRVIICCSDGAAEEIIYNKKKLELFYNMPETKMEIKLLMQKDKQGEIAEKCGLKCPKSKVYSVKENIDWDIFPCIIKPIKSIVGAGKDDIVVIYNKDELIKIIPSVVAESIQIQQYIKKDIEYQLIGCSLEKGSKIIIPGFTELIRQPQNTNTGYLRYNPIVNLNNDMEAVFKFIRKIGYSGLFSMEFIRGKDKIDYFLEINMRNDGNAYCVNTAGVNLPYIWCYYQLNKSLPTCPQIIKHSILFIPDFNDIKLGIKEVGLLKWIKQFNSAESHSIYNKYDIGPFIFEIFRIIRKILVKYLMLNKIIKIK